MRSPSAAVRAVEPIEGPLAATVSVPGSKSLTNRALVCAALAEGVSEIEGALVADDTEAMASALRALGAGIVPGPGGRGAGRGARLPSLTVTGTGGDLAPGPQALDLRLSGTASRFLLPVVALGSGRYRMDGRPPLRARPMGPVLAAIEALGARVEPHGPAGHLPATVAAAGRLAGGRVEITGDASSQYVSGLLLAAPYCREGLHVTVTTPLVGRAFVDMTVAVMAAFGAGGVVVAEGASGPVFTVPAGRYRGTRYRVEPDASAASYFLAAAAICGGRVTVEGLGEASLQGDAHFADVLATMGAGVDRSAGGTTVSGPARLAGLGDVDLSAMPDMAQTLAAVAVFADAPTRVRGIGFIRGHETDRIAATVRELRRCGVDAREEPDGFVVHPGMPRAAQVRTYDDHRMAMSFALLGLRVPGIAIEDPGCVAKTFPGYWDTVDRLRARGSEPVG
jgi:3-phosphoshikimate 1-carboxyvinyltransferase